MKIWRRVPVLVPLGFSAIALAVGGATEMPRHPGSVSRLEEAKGPAIAKNGALPSLANGLNARIPFVVNEGQVHPSVQLYAQTFVGAVFITHDHAIAYSLPGRRDSIGAEGMAIRESLVNATVGEVTGREPAISRVSHFVGNDRSRWKRGLRMYEVADFGEVYEGVRFHLRAHAKNVEKLFTVESGGNPNDIRIQVDGVESLRLDENGQLLVESPQGSVAFTSPVAYQEDEGGRRPVQVAYAIEGNTYGFTLGAYDKERPLIIDPFMAATYLGDAGVDGHYEVPIVVDDFGNVYVASRTQSPDFPTPGGAYPEYNGGTSDVFVAKLDADLTTLLAGTFLGGSDAEGVWPGVALALAADGTVYVAGGVMGSDFPVPPGGYVGPNLGGENGFVSRLSANLDTLLASAVFGGTGIERYIQMALDGDGHVRLVGSTASGNFPTTPGAYWSSLKPGGHFGFDLFLTKFSADLSTIMASTYLGGTDDEFSEAIHVNDVGDAFVVGWTPSRDFPTSTGAFARTHGGGPHDGFVSRMDSDLTTLVASTYLGGSEWDFVYAMALDESGDVYVTGHTASAGPSGKFPVTPGAYEEDYSGVGGPNVGDDAFVSKLNAGLTDLLTSTFLGDTAWEIGTFLAIDSNGNVYVAGTTTSSAFPTTPGAYDRAHGGGLDHSGDVFVSRFDANLTDLQLSTFVGGSGPDTLGSFALDASGDLYVAGATASADFPTTDGAYQPEYAGPTAWDWGGDVFIARLSRFLAPDCNDNGIPDICDIDCSAACGECNVAGCGGSSDVDGNWRPDDCCELASSALPEPDVVIKNRYLSFVPGDTIEPAAIRVTFTDLPAPWDVWNGVQMWVGQPQERCELGGVRDAGATCGTAGTFFSATLQCEASYRDWSPYGTIHVYHEGIVADGRYMIEMLADGCPSNVEEVYSTPLILDMGIWGDVCGPFDSENGLWTPPDHSVNVASDVVALLDKFMSAPGALSKARADIEPATVDLIINITDAVVAIDAFRGLGYPFAPGPIPCAP